jgi:thymidylate synthase (FAD)
MTHSTSSGQADIKVLDKGFVRLVDVMGGDDSVVNSARVSYGSGSKGEEKDKKLIQYLLRHQHMTPFEHAVFQFHVSCPIFVMRQWIRHRASSYNEISARYTEVKDEFYVPDVFRAPDPKNTQSSAPSPAIDDARCRKLVEDSQRQSYAAYQELLKSGVAREIARSVLPVGQYTQFYWTINARNLMHFIELRADAAAQYEIQRYAEALGELFRGKMPWTWEAFVRFAWKGVNPAIDAQKKQLEAVPS